MLGFCSMLIDMRLPKFDIYQSTIASNYFKSHVKSRYSDFFQTKLLSNVRSEIQLVRRNINFTGQSVCTLKKCISRVEYCSWCYNFDELVKMKFEHNLELENICKTSFHQYLGTCWGKQRNCYDYFSEFSLKLKKKIKFIAIMVF